jgi:putative hydrolase of the HAD superfamily
MTESIQAVIFDLDDTLFDHYYSLQAGLTALQKTTPNLQQQTLDDLTSTYVDLVESLHIQVLQKQLTLDQARIQRMQSFFLKYGRTLSVDEAQNYAEHYRGVYLAARQPVPGAIALLRHLRTRNVKTAIITNNASLEQREKLEFCKLTPLIDVVVISEEVGVIKPDPAIFAIALKQLECNASQAIMVGDAWNTDILGAHRAGIKSIWLNRFGARCPDPSITTIIHALEPASTVADILLKTNQ